MATSQALSFYDLATAIETHIIDIIPQSCAHLLYSLITAVYAVTMETNVPWKQQYHVAIP